MLTVLTVFGKILSIIGMILLILLGIIFVFLLLILFFPIFYKVFGEKDNEKLELHIRIKWLFGILSCYFDYLESGKFLVKIAGFTIVDSSRPPNANSQKEESSNETVNTKENTTQEPFHQNETKEDNFAKENSVKKDKIEEESLEKNMEEDSQTEEESLKGIPRIFHLIAEKYHKIRYAIQKIYDKIKYVLEHLSFYKKLLNEEDTKKLLKHGWLRFKKICKSIRPRKYKVNLTFGAESPDTTGYVYGIYGILSPKLGKNVVIIPDFNEAVLTGEIFLVGHITIGFLLFQVVRLLLDKKLWKLIKKVKNYEQSYKETAVLAEEFKV